MFVCFNFLSFWPFIPSTQTSFKYIPPKYIFTCLMYFLNYCWTFSKFFEFQLVLQFELSASSTSWQKIEAKVFRWNNFFLKKWNNKNIKTLFSKVNKVQEPRDAATLLTAARNDFRVGGIILAYHLPLLQGLLRNFQIVGRIE